VFQLGNINHFILLGCNKFRGNVFTCGLILCTQFNHLSLHTKNPQAIHNVSVLDMQYRLESYIYNLQLKLLTPNCHMATQNSCLELICLNQCSQSWIRNMMQFGARDWSCRMHASGSCMMTMPQLHHT
jgi:hypothetical protein